VSRAGIGSACASGGGTRCYPDSPLGPNRTVITESAWDAWFASYTSFVMRYAAFADARWPAVESIDIAFGLDTALQHAPNSPRWVALAAAVRGKYRGKLVATGSAGSLDQVPIKVRCKRLCIPSHTRTHTHTRARAHTHTHTRAHTHTHKRARTHKHAHTALACVALARQVWGAVDRIGVDATDVSLAAPAWQKNNAESGGANTTVADERVVVTPEGVAAAWEQPLQLILRVGTLAAKQGT
jgi:hypothetical protein